MRILLIEDEKILRVSLDKSLTKAGYIVSTCEDGSEALSNLAENKYDIVLTDIRLPNADGFEILNFISTNHPKTKVIMMTAFGSIEAAVDALKQGAVDYITKPFTKEELLHRLAKIRDYQSVLEENKELKKELKIKRKIIGEAPAFIKIIEQVKLAAAKDYTILIEGESGTGKELIVDLIHELSPRNNKTLIKVNCSALPEALFESELFGHEKGSFTGALKRNVGRFERANGGTIFLDDIDDLPYPMQVKLLRVLQEREIERIGGDKTIPIDIRLIVATKIDLKKEMESGKFRNDLFYRINVVRIKIPLLKERKSDIPFLVNHFLLKHGTQQKITPNVLKLLMEYDWPGNIRELENLIVQMIAISKNNILDDDLLPSHFTQNISTDIITNDSLSINISNSEKKMITNALEKCKWSQKEAAKLLGIPRTTLRSKMKKYELI
jgi:DNA-binding NtrC family response regulator